MFGTDVRFPLPPLSWGASERLLDRWCVRALGSPLCPLGHLFSAGGPELRARGQGCSTRHRHPPPGSSPAAHAHAAHGHGHYTGTTAAGGWLGIWYRYRCSWAY
jgi:hypothetical protein